MLFNFSSLEDICSVSRFFCPSACLPRYSCMSVFLWLCPLKIVRNSNLDLKNSQLWMYSWAIRVLNQESQMKSLKQNHESLETWIRVTRVTNQSLKQNYELETWKLGIMRVMNQSHESHKSEVQTKLWIIRDMNQSHGSDTWIRVIREINQVPESESWVMIQVSDLFLIVMKVPVVNPGVQM